MPPHRLLGPAAVCGACITSAPASSSLAGGRGSEPGDDLEEEYFRPRSIFYVHPHGVHECAECAQPAQPTIATATANQPSTLSNPSLDLYDDDEDEVDGDEDEEDDSEDIMGSRRRQIYETAFDCKIAKSDDDLDEVDRITNCSVLLQLSNGNGSGTSDIGKATTGSSKTRAECKRAKNSKNQALQEQTGEAHVQVHQVQAELGKLQLISQVDQQNQNQQQQQQQQPPSQGQQLQLGATAGSGVSASSTQQLPVRGYTPSPPSTAPLPMKFPGKHERYLNMNSIRSAPNLPAANPAHPRLRDLRLPIQSMRNQCGGGGGGGSSNDNSLTDSAYVNPPSTNSNSNAASGSASASVSATGSAAAVRRPRSFVLESGRVLELRRSAQGGHHHHHQQSGGGGGGQSSHHHHHHHHHGGGAGSRSRNRQAQGQTAGGGGHNYSSTESIATSSSGGSMESLRSSTSEGNRSTSSSESRHSSSLSSHSSESGSGGSGGSSVAYPLRPAPLLLHSKLHILSPISDKSSQEPASASASEQSQQPSQAPMAAQEEDSSAAPPGSAVQVTNPTSASMKQRSNRGSGAPNKALLQLADELLGSDSGISLHSREEGKPQALALQRLTLPKLQLIGAEGNTITTTTTTTNTSSSGAGNSAGAGGSGATASGSAGLPQDLRDLPFDMPKLRRRKTLQQEAACTSGSATSVDLGELPFDMPKLRRRLRANQAEINNLLMHSTESSGISQASSSHSMRDDQKLASKLDTALFRQNLTLNLNDSRQASKQFGSLDLRGLNSNKELNMNLSQGYVTAVDLIDVTIPLERQGWYHGAITRVEAETTLRPLSEGSFLVRNCESTKQDYSLSLKGAKGFMHMRIQRNETGQYILGQFSRPFETVPEMIRHFCLNRLPVRGAEHMCLIEPVIAQLL
ncbi:pneumococcal serine-rich repeat protein isoform X2 [Drosophila takahashii]